MKIISVGLCITLTGCASIIHGTRQDIGISSNPSGAMARTNSGRMCYTPCILNLSRSESDTLTFEKEGYEPASGTITSSVSGWVWGNIVFGGPIGLGVDFISGGAYKLEPESINQRLERVNYKQENFEMTPDKIQKINLNDDKIQSLAEIEYRLLYDFKKQDQLKVILKKGEIINGTFNTYNSEWKGFSIIVGEEQRLFYLNDIKSLHKK